MIATLLLALFIDFTSAEVPSSFSVGPLRVTGKQVTTSILTNDEKDLRSITKWRCESAGNAILTFGDITGQADTIAVTQLDRDRYQFSLKGATELRMRGITAMAGAISWTMDENTPMVFEGNAKLTIVIDGKSTTVASNKITFNSVANTLELADGTVTSLPTTRTHFLRK